MLTEAELVVGDIPIVPGYKSFVPRLSSSAKVRVVMLVRSDFHAEQLDTGPAPDIQVVAVKVRNEALVGVYRQFS